jgi:hypothetical protein
MRLVSLAQLSRTYATAMLMRDIGAMLMLRFLIMRDIGAVQLMLTHNLCCVASQAMSPRHKFMSLPYYYYDLCRVSAQLSVRTDRLMSRASKYRNALRSAQLMCIVVRSRSVQPNIVA